MGFVLLALALLATCVIVQSVGMLVLIRWLARVRRILESPSTHRRVALLLRLFVGIVLLHLVQVGLWAVVFWRAPELPNLETALYFSLATYTKLGFGDVVVGPGWRVVAGIERLTGILLVGWSTAFVCAVVKGMYEHWRAGAQHVLTHHAADFEFERHGRGAPRRGGETPRLQERATAVGWDVTLRTPSEGYPQRRRAAARTPEHVRQTG